MCNTAIVFVQCNGYSGPETPGWTGLDSTWIPIIPVTAHWEDRLGKDLTGTQFPLALAWAIAIHKSQALILLEAAINLGPTDFQAGLAISHVKSLKDLAFRSHFPWS
ncbi:hypothetical protein BDZ94DRAFT_640175 [Collybia nuda]|uniref:Uncharacterized protein n=1 Tax=Collybia nuda TaxID=64659 RepID=A0A9P5Y7H3_9AGAR|nr:hypothetical protein BDZ94DRAFT_640175 [Collybia nuda]